MRGMYTKEPPTNEEYFVFFFLPRPDSTPLSGATLLRRTSDLDGRSSSAAHLSN